MLLARKSNVAAKRAKVAASRLSLLPSTRNKRFDGQGLTTNTRSPALAMRL